MQQIATAPAIEPRLMADDIAALLRVTTRTVHNWVARGQFPPPTKIGRRSTWDRAIVETYLRTRTGALAHAGEEE